MSSYRSFFQKKATLLLVIHAEDPEQALRNADKAVEEDADGIFLINHRITATKLLNCFDRVRDRYRNLWIGMNFLDLPAAVAFNVLPPEAQGLWVDDPGIVETASDPTEKARRLAQVRYDRVWHGLYFGSVAFKYQKLVANPAQAARLALPFVDVVTTSGDATGSPPIIEKIRDMKTAVGSHPLAIASGITPENVHDYLGLADCFLVATGVSDSPTELNQSRVRKLVKAIA